MKKSKLSRSAPYSTTYKKERLAIDTLKILLSHDRTVPDLREGDKIPNTDGYIEMIDESSIPIGKLEVQVKALPDKYRTNPKFSFPIRTFSYSEVIGNPFLLIVVDTDEKKAYWVHVNRDFISKLKIRDGKKSKVIHFPKDNLIDSKNIEYINKWENIIKKRLTKIQNFDELEESYTILDKKSNPILGFVKRDFQNIHVFLDEINSLLDGKFLIVKKRFYSNAWKMGLAYYSYGDTSISYTLYPISFNKNDIQIKEVNETLRKQLEHQGLGFTSHFLENPIKLRPKEYANEIVESKTLKLLEKRLLNHYGNEFLAKEFIFAFIDRFFQQMGLDEKDRYSLNEIEKAFFEHLPVWVDETIKFMVKIKRNRVRKPIDCMYRQSYFDPDLLISGIMDKERKQIKQSVKTRIERKDSIPDIPIGNNKYPFQIFIEFLSFLKSLNIKNVERVYFQKDYSMLKKKGNLVWNTLSPKAIERNLKTFFDNLPEVYNSILLQNFPEIIEELPLFGDASRLIILFSVRKKYKTFKDSPKIQFFHLNSKTPDILEIEIYGEGERKAPKISHLNFKKGVELNRKKYKLISMSSGILKFIYDDLPMFNFVYKTLEENLKKYFSRIA